MQDFGMAEVTSPVEIPPSLFFFTSNKLVIRRTETVITSESYFSQMCITKVMFTQRVGRATIQSWFGSSGGGLPRRPELIVQDVFLFPDVSTGPLATCFHSITLG